MMGPVEELLREAWAVIEDPKNRTKMFMARDSNEMAVEPNDSTACKWCSLGAIYKAGNYSQADNRFCKTSETFNQAHSLLLKAARDFVCCIPISNDSDVIGYPPKLYAKAIELAVEENM